MFRPGSPLSLALNKFTDVMLLNLLVMLLCIPVVTAGAAFTAMHAVLYPLMDDSEGRIYADFFRTFRRCFRKATALWLMMLVIFGLLGADLWLMIATQVPAFVAIPVLIAALLIVLVLQHVFPLLAHFDTSVHTTLRNAAHILLTGLPRSLGMLMVHLIPVFAFIFSYSTILVIFLFGFSLPAYLNCFLYRKVFRSMEAES